MLDFFSWLCVAAMFGMLLGLIKPGLVLHWGKTRTRGRALAWYGLFAVISIVGAAAFVPPGEDVTPVQSPQVAATAEPAAPAEGQTDKLTPEVRATATEEIKANIRAFEKELNGYDAVSALYMENAKAMTKQLGKSASMGDLYQALKEAHKYAQAGADLVFRTQVPEELPEPVEAALETAKEASWQMMLSRRDALKAFMEWVETQKPSAQTAMQEESNASTLQAVKSVEALLQAKRLAGFTGEEIEADLRAKGTGASQ